MNAYSASALVFAVSALAPTAAAQASAQASVTAFMHVSVIPMDTERVLADQTVLVRGDRIVALGPATQVPVPAGAVRIDGRGKFLLPGLADMHAHTNQPLWPLEPGVDRSEASWQRTYALFVAHGVTTIRSMFGRPQDVTFRERAAAGEALAPRIYVEGHDFAKIYAQSGPQLDHVIAEARRTNRPIVGHVLDSVGLDWALRLPYASIEHFSGYLEYLTGRLVESTMTDTAVEQAWSRPADLDMRKVRAIAAATRQAGVWICPTLAAWKNLGVDWSVLQQRPEMRYLSVAAHERWAKAFAAKRLAFGHQFQAKRRLVKPFHDAGVGLLLGSDPALPMLVPGVSVHQELEELVAAGLTPYQALATGTRNPATFLGTLDSAGTVVVGKQADLVLLGANPLADIRHTARITGVMVRGRWLARSDLDTLLASLAQPLAP